MAFFVVDSKTGSQIGGMFKDRNKARMKADQLDMAYGAYRYVVRSTGGA